jgi:phage tail sheath protein FI
MTYGRPGVYVTERLLPGQLAETGTANAAGAIVAQLAQGPTTVTRVTSWYQFVQLFGGYNVSYPATFGVGQFFQNGGTELYVRRILHAYTNFAGARITDGTNTLATVTAVAPGSDGTNLRVQFTATGVTSPANYYNLTVYRENGTNAGVVDDIVLEQFLNVRFDDSTSSDFVESVVNGASQYVTISVSDKTKNPAATLFPLINLTSGGTAADLDGGTVVYGDYTAALDDFLSIERPLVVFAPEVIRALGSSTYGANVHSALVTWAETNNQFAIIDTPADLPVSGTTSALSYAAAAGTSSHAAVYYPNVYMADPLGRNASSVRKVGPAGAVAGLYLATDSQFGPFKAPAGLNATLGGVVSLERKFTSADLDTLNSNAHPVNAIRNIPGVGIAVMGARTLKQDGTANRYVSMRRSLIYIRKELESITQFALFENNDTVLWSRIRTSLGIFLNQYRNQGGLAGTSPSEAYYVKCDRENNTAASIANGEVHIEVGVALQYPAEFVVITLSQKTAV